MTGNKETGNGEKQKENKKVNEGVAAEEIAETGIDIWRSR